jgi:hypothetical protein
MKRIMYGYVEKPDGAAGVTLEDLLDSIEETLVEDQCILEKEGKGLRKVKVTVEVKNA